MESPHTTPLSLCPESHVEDIENALFDFKHLVENYDPNITAVGVDFETYYSDTCSVADSTYYNYTHHPEFDAYMVAIYCPALNIEYVGHPSDFDWSQIHGLIWLAHNAPFDRAVYQWGCPQIAALYQPHAWVNTADLAAFNKAPRSLAQAAFHLLGRKRDKQVRANMKGRKFDEITEEEKKEWLEYALDDSIDCVDLWDKYKDDWNRDEQLLSLHTTELVFRGVAVDVEKLEKDLEVLKKVVHEIEFQIPWAGEPELTKTGKHRMKKGEPVYKKPTSTLELNKFAREQGIPLPSTTDAKSPEFQEWEEVHGEKFPLIKSIQTWRKCNRALRLCETIKNRLRPDNRMEFQLLYFGAATGRWAGTLAKGSIDGEDESGINMQNLTKKPLHIGEDRMLITDPKKFDEAVHIHDLRSLFIAGKGYKAFGIPDLSQIEPRCLSYVLDDSEFLELVKDMSPYEAHARLTMGWTGGDLKEENPSMYAFAKARVLALGYGAGWVKFISMAAMYVSKEEFDEIFKSPITPEQEAAFLKYAEKYAKPQHNLYDTLEEEIKCIWVNSWTQVMEYRKSNKLVTHFWKKLQFEFDKSCVMPDPATQTYKYEVELYSGRQMQYFNCSKTAGKAQQIRGGSMKNVYGGLICENLIQAVARDIMGWCILNLERNGFKVLWHVHDEAIIELEQSQTVKQAMKIMKIPAPWAPEIPISSEGEEHPHYTK